MRGFFPYCSYRMEVSKFEISLSFVLMTLLSWNTGVDRGAHELVTLTVRAKQCDWKTFMKYSFDPIDLTCRHFCCNKSNPRLVIVPVRLHSLPHLTISRLYSLYGVYLMYLQLLQMYSRYYNYSVIHLM